MAQPSLKPLRNLGVAIALSLAALFACAPAAALGATSGGPATGSVKLSLSAGFKRQLKQNGVKLKPTSFTVKNSSIEPASGGGSMTLNGKLKLKKSGRKVSLRPVTASLGKGGALKAGGTKLFALRGGSISREGFGSTIGGVKMKLLRAGARKLNRKLGLRSLHPGRAGTLSGSVAPKTIPVKDGQTRVAPSVAGNSIGFKLLDHCVNPLLGFGGVVPIAPASEDAGMSFTFPAVGGTIGPDGNAGFTSHSGGVQVNKTNTTGVCGTVPSDARAIQTDLQFDLKGNHVFAHSVIAGYPPPLGTDKGVAIAYEIDKKQMKIDANPNASKITISGLELSLSSASAIFLNLIFPNSTGNPARDFAAGDPYGTATMTLNTG
jgi:hypothetical protein